MFKLKKGGREGEKKREGGVEGREGEKWEFTKIYKPYTPFHQSFELKMYLIQQMPIQTTPHTHLNYNLFKR